MRNIIAISLILPVHVFAYSPDSEILRQQLQQREEESRKAYLKERNEKALKNKQQQEKAKEAVRKEKHKKEES